MPAKIIEMLVNVMEELLKLLMEQMEFCPPDDELQRLISDVQGGEDETLLQDDDLENIRAAAGVPQIPGSTKPAHNDASKK